MTDHPCQPVGQPSTRERLIAAAFVAVAKHGFDGASVKQIASEAGVTPGLLHYHFPTRDALLEAALKRALEDYLARSRERREAIGPDQQITAFFKAARGTLEADRNIFRVRLSFAAKALSSPALAVALRDLNRASVEETALTFAAARGAATASDPDLALASTLKAAFDGLMLNWLTDPSFPMAEAGRLLELTVREALAGRGDEAGAKADIGSSFAGERHNE